MNWASVRFDWNQVRAFLATAEEGTLSAAARGLGLTQPTLGRQVAALEEELGVTLFERVGRSLVLTEAGAALLTHVRAMGDAAQRVSLVAAGQSTVAEGDVRLSASDALCAYILPGLMAGLREIAPGVTVELISENRVSDLMRREADIAIRHVEPTEPDLIGRRLKDARGRFYAARSWIDANGRPETLTDLEGVEMIGLDDPARFVMELGKRGIDMPMPVFPLRSENGVVMWEMVRAGLGIGIMSDVVAAQTGGVEALEIPGLPPLPVPVWLITHREIRTARRIRVVFDYMAEALNRLA